MNQSTENLHPGLTCVCQIHPDRPSRLVCQKFGIGFCEECCKCPHPTSHCKYRTQCLIREFCGDDDKESAEM